MLSRKLDTINKKLSIIMPGRDYRIFNTEMQKFIHLAMRNIAKLPDSDSGDYRIDQLIQGIITSLSFEDPDVTFQGTKVVYSRFFPYWETSYWSYYWINKWTQYYWWDWNPALIFPQQ